MNYLREGLSQSWLIIKYFRSLSSVADILSLPEIYTQDVCQAIANIDTSRSY